MKPELLTEARAIAAMTRRVVRMRIPSVLAEGEQFALDISVIGADVMPDGDFNNTLHFEDSAGIEGLPASFALPPGESTARLEGLTATNSDVAVARARVEGAGHLEGDPVIESNPAWVFDDPPWRLYWGDIHIHTRYSNCSGWRCLDPEWALQFSREISLLDFAAPADHLRGIAWDTERWPRLQALTRQYTEDGRFIPFLAFESSHKKGWGGDNNVYFLDDDAPYFWVDREDMKGISPEVHLKELWKQMDETGKPYFTAPHHTGRSGKYRTWEENYHDPVREPLFEIYSSWGSSEARWTRFPITGANNNDPSYFVDALKAGARFGVIASSDDHATLPGAVHQHRIQPYEEPTQVDQCLQGLAAVRAKELTRPALFEAMRSRNTYATTMARTLLDFTIGDLSMGQEGPADSQLKKKRTIRLDVTLDRGKGGGVTLLRNGEEIASQSIPKDHARGRASVVFEDDEPLERIALKNTLFRKEPFVVYHARVTDNHSWHQWTSPIWLDLE